MTHVHKPHYFNGKWSISIHEDNSPLSKLIERITFSTREAAWQGYRKIMEDFTKPTAGYTVTGDKKAETPLAILLVIQEKELWIPKKCIKIIKGNVYVLSYWYAKQKGLVI